jgi:hypothetical protein
MRCSRSSRPWQRALWSASARRTGSMYLYIYWEGVCSNVRQEICQGREEGRKEERTDGRKDGRTDGRTPRKERRQAGRQEAGRQDGRKEGRTKFLTLLPPPPPFFLHPLRSVRILPLISPSLPSFFPPLFHQTVRTNQWHV